MYSFINNSDILVFFLRNHELEASSDPEIFFLLMVPDTIESLVKKHGMYMYFTNNILICLCSIKYVFRN